MKVKVKKMPAKIHLLGCSACKHIDKDKTLLTCTKHNIICKLYTRPCTEFERRQK